MENFDQFMASLENAFGEQGDAIAKNSLGLCCRGGRGVPRDYAPAYMWFNIDFANGHKCAGERRDSLADEMKQRQIAKARARTCMASDDQDCD